MRLFRAAPLMCVILSLGALLVPVARTRMPPLLDYPNHVARMWLLAGGAEQAPLDVIYKVDWAGATTNIGADLMAATLGRLIGIWTLAPILLGAAVLLPPLGAVLLNRAVFGGWHWWQAGFAILAWNSTLVAGFLSFQIGLGLALLAAALDPTLLRRARPGVIPVRMSLTVLLTVVHPFATGLYGVLLAGLAFGAGQDSSDRGPVGRRLWRAAITSGLGVAIPVLCFLLLAPKLPGGHAPEGVYDAWGGYTLINKIVTLLSAVLTYNFLFDLIIVFAFLLVIVIATRRSAHQVHTGLTLSALGLVVLAVLTPSVVAGTACVDWRFPIMAALTAAAAFRPGTQLGRERHLMAAFLMVLTLARTGWIASVWQERQADVAALEEVLAFVPAGAAILPVTRTGHSDMLAPGRLLAVGFPSYWQLPSLAVPFRRAFVPTLFAAPGKQPVRVLPPWSEIAVLEGLPAPVSYLRTLVPSPPDPYRSYVHGYMARWRERFHYVLVLNAQAPDLDDEEAVPGLVLLADRGFARIYQVVEVGTDRLGGP